MNNDETYGLNFNFSLVMNNEDISMGVNISDSSGIESSAEVCTDNMEEGFNALVEEVLSDILFQKLNQAVEEEKEEKPEESLEDKVQSLEADKALLEARLQDLQEKLNEQKQNVSKSSKSFACGMKQKEPGIDLEILNYIQSMLGK